jgi:hypothetical protein
MKCDDITQFVGVKQVANGGYDMHGNYLGKMVRWYYADGETGYIKKKDGSRVAGTTGAFPCMDLPDDFPDDINYAWYVREAYARLDDIGLNVRNPRLAGRQGYRIAALPKQKTAHIIDLQSMTSLCGREEKKAREPWEEMRFVPDDMRVCRKCQDERALPDDEADDEE